MKDYPLVSIVIPTYNSEKTLPLCLKSVRKQTYKNIEVIIVDSKSRDRTLEIARRFGARVIVTGGGLLWARYLGHLYARGEIEVLLDSDQVLAPFTIDNSVRMIKKGFDMLILEESSFKVSTPIELLFYFDRKYVHKILDINPIHGVLLARVFRRELLDKVFDSILKKLPVEIAYKLVAQDHALIYYEAWKLARKIGLIRNAVYHIEPSSLRSVIRKFYRYGVTEINLSRYYPELLRGKKSPRKVVLCPEFFLSLLLWIIKAIPYALGRFLNS